MQKQWYNYDVIFASIVLEQLELLGLLYGHILIKKLNVYLGLLQVIWYSLKQNKPYQKLDFESNV